VVALWFLDPFVGFGGASVSLCLCWLLSGFAGSLVALMLLAVSLQAFLALRCVSANLCGSFHVFCALRCASVGFCGSLVCLCQLLLFAAVYLLAFVAVNTVSVGFCGSSLRLCRLLLPCGPALCVCWLLKLLTMRLLAISGSSLRLCRLLLPCGPALCVCWL
jgi:hypothetical protein